MDVDCTLSHQSNGKPDSLGSKEIILENDADRYLVSQCTKEDTQEMDVDDLRLDGRRYKLSLFPRKEGSFGMHVNEGGQEAQKHEDSVNGITLNKTVVKESDLVTVMPPIEDFPAHSANRDLELRMDQPPQSLDKEQLRESTDVASTLTRSTPNNVQNNNDVVLTAPMEVPQSPPTEAPSQLPLHDIANGLGEGDILFIPDGIRIARGKMNGDLPPGGSSKLDWFLKVARWKWRESTTQEGP